MNKKGTRNTNGEGGIYSIISKTDRKKNRKNFVCEVCKNCNDWSVCNYREGTNKCQKCTDCRDCLKKGFCDRFYCYEYNQAQISIDGKQTTVANEKKRRDAVEKKKVTESEVQTKSYVKKNGIRIIEVCRKIQKNKLDAGDITENTMAKDNYHYKRIEEWEDFNKPVQKVTYEEVQDFLNSLRYLSQRRNR